MSLLVVDLVEAAVGDSVGTGLATLAAMQRATLSAQHWATK